MTNEIIFGRDPRILFSAFSDPREFERFKIDKLQSGDYAVIINARPGAIYFFRSWDGIEPDNAFEGDVLMTHLLLGPNADRGDKILRRLIKGYDLIYKKGPDMDGVFVPFYILRKIDGVMTEK